MPTNETALLTAETEALRGLYAAIDGNDIAAALDVLDPRIERMEPAGFPSAGTYRGHTALREHLCQGRGTWAEGTCAPEAFFAVGDKIVVFLYVHVRLKNATEWIEGRFADGFIFRDGKAIQWRTFAERRDACAWAGVSPAGT